MTQPTTAPDYQSIARWAMTTRNEARAILALSDFAQQTLGADLYQTIGWLKKVEDGAAALAQEAHHADL